MLKRSAWVFVLGAAALFSGCGGGGDSPPGTDPSFPLLAGYRARISAGATDNFTVSGTCTGTATFSESAPTAATFEGVQGFATVQTATLSLINCTPATGSVSGTSYHDSNYAPLGTSVPDLVYEKFATTPSPLPASVKVGDTAVYATLTAYTDSSKSVTTGQEVLSYVIEADTAGTAVVNFIARSYDTSNQLLSTQQSRYRIAADGTLTTISVDLQYSTTSSTHLVFTKA